MNYKKQDKLNIFMIVAFSAIFLIAPWAAAADIPGDIAEPYGKVDLADLTKLVEWWMVSVCDMFDDCFGADMSGPEGVPDGIVNLYDFSVVAAHWMEGA